jgi:two-component system NtrC family sensor kinase
MTWEQRFWCCEDNGIGLAPENLEKVFEPFYTTKEPGKGVGLGLSICHRIMAQHFGTITLSNLTQGVKAELKFPRERPN